MYENDTYKKQEFLMMKDHHQCTCNKNNETRKDYLQTKIDEYSESFTIHGLTRSVKGKKLESIFWSVILAIGVISCSMVIHGLVVKFRSHSVYTEIRFQITDRNYFPSITFCELNSLLDSYFAYCGVPPRLSGRTSLDPNLPCSYKHKITEAKVKQKEYHHWATEMFNVTHCGTWGGKRCASSRYFKSLAKVNNSCITWNYEGGFYDMYSHAEIEFLFKKPKHFYGKPKIIAILNDPLIEEIDITRKIDIEPDKHYGIKIDKTIIKRLPAPFPANCSNNKNGDIFPGRYSRHSCIESGNFIRMYEQCGDTLDYTRNYIPEHIKRKHKRNDSVAKVEHCIRTFSRKELNPASDCRFPCEDLDLHVVSSVHEGNHAFKKSKIPNDTTRYEINVQFQRVDTYKIMEEKELYTWDQMACEIGGFIGLIMGMSIISLVEVLAFICLTIAKWLTTSRK